MVYGCEDGTVERWAVATRQRVWQAQHHTNSVTCVAIVSDGQTGASGSWDRTVRLWQTNDGQLLRTVKTQYTVWCLAFAPDGQRLASGMSYGALAVWDVATGRPVRYLLGHFESVIIGFMPCGRRLISASLDSTVRIWDVVEGRLWQTVAFEPDSIRDVGLARDGTVLVATVRGMDVVLWRVLPLAAV